MLKKVLAGLRGLRAEGKVSPDPLLLPLGHRIYAIGDIHGRADLLRRMRDLVAADLARTQPEEALIVFLGDYVDRGPQSKAVLDCLLDEDFGAPTLHLRGNHEAMLLDFLYRPETGETWRKFGGIETIHSYGVDVADFKVGQGLSAVARQLRAAIPPRISHSWKG